MAGKLEGKVAFITGAARGQGRSHALRLAEEGADIIAVDLCEAVPGVQYKAATPEDLAETVKQVEALDRRIVATKADVRDVDALTKAVDDGVAELGRLDYIVANAGIDIIAPWFDVSHENFRDTIDTNLVGVWNTVTSAIGHIRDRGEGGSIVLISSANGIKAGPFNIAYNAAKFGVTALAKSFAMELGGERIRVNSIHPGPVETDMGTGAIDDISALDEKVPGLLPMLNTWLPDMFMQPREISNAVLYLLSDDSKFVTGLSMAVDAGMSMY